MAPLNRVRAWRAFVFVTPPRLHVRLQPIVCSCFSACLPTMSHSRDVSAIIAMIAAELLLATVNVTVKWASSWPNPNPT